jgi:hypothetical protein
LCSTAAFLAGALGISCGAGVHDGRGEVFAVQTIDQGGGQVVLAEAALEVCEGCVGSPASITLRRYDSIAHRGAIGPVFEIELPASDTFASDPRISIATSPEVAGSANSVIGFFVPGAVNEQWIPDSPGTMPVCPASVVCGPVQRYSFMRPGGDPTQATRVVRFAIVSQCSINADCPSSQACTSGACQECPQGSPCN